MKIFVSWSGDRSRAIAEALRRWIPDVLHPVEAWTSEHGVEAGALWGQELDKALADCRFGILCVTADNQHSPWLVFEAGCLSRTSQIARVVPYLHDIAPADIEYPLAQFQSVAADQAGTLRLLQGIVDAGGLQIAPDRLARMVERWWPDLDKALRTISVSKQVPQGPQRSERDMLEELLELVRSGLRTGAASRYDTTTPQTTAESDPSILIDLSTFIPNGRVTAVDFKRNMKVNTFLDRVYFRLNDFTPVDPYTYGTVWLLRDRKSGYVYSAMGRDFARLLDQDDDHRRIVSLGIAPGSALEVIRPDMA